MTGSSCCSVASATTFPKLRHLWVDCGYNCKGKGKDWVEAVLILASLMGSLKVGDTAQAAPPDVVGRGAGFWRERGDLV